MGKSSSDWAGCFECPCDVEAIRTFHNVPTMISHLTDVFSMQCSQTVKTLVFYPWDHFSSAADADLRFTCAFGFEDLMWNELQHSLKLYKNVGQHISTNARASGDRIVCSWGSKWGYLDQNARVDFCKTGAIWPHVCFFITLQINHCHDISNCLLNVSNESVVTNLSDNAFQIFIIIYPRIFPWFLPGLLKSTLSIKSFVKIHFQGKKCHFNYLRE